MSFYETVSKISKIKLGKVREMYGATRDLWASLTDEQKTMLYAAIASVLTPDQLIKGTEIYGMWKELWKSED